MTAPGAGTAFVDFFVLEASEYVEQIDGLVARAAAVGPDSEALQKIARALRGTATMAKLPSFAELASTIESVGRALRQGALPWNEPLKGALVAAIDDLKLLVRAARAWSPAEDQWALRRIAELSQFVAPQAAPGAAAATPGAFFTNETTNIAAGLELLATRPDDRVAALNVLTRVRALRGVAGMKEIPALGEVSEAAETALRPLEMGADARLTHEHMALLRAAADLMRAIIAGLARNERVTPSTPEYRAFLAAQDAMEAHGRGAERVVPVAQLFYDDAGPHIVEKAANPPTTPGQRFRMEVVSLGEHLHRIISEARLAVDDIQREHAKGELARALRAIRATAASFEQLAVAQTVEGYLERTGDLTAQALDAISSFAATISPAPVTPPPVDPNSVPIRMTQVRSAVGALGSPASPAAPPAPPAPAVPPAPAAPAAPSAQAAQAARAAQAAPVTASPLDAAIASFESLATERFAEPAAVAEDMVPVDALLYRGHAALDRAIALRDSIRAAGGPPAADVLEEIYDLLDLARVPEPSF